jgi:hypothetical protein
LPQCFRDRQIEAEQIAVVSRTHSNILTGV